MKFSESERRAKGRVRLYRALGSAELREVASGSATQSFWLRNGKVGSQVSGMDRSRFPGRGTLGEVRRGGRQGRRASDKAEKRVRLSLTESLTSFTNRTFHFTRPPVFRRAFDAAERNGKFGRIQCQRGKEGSSRGKRKRRVFLCRRTVGVKVISKSIPASFLKIEGRGALVGAIDRRERGINKRIGKWSVAPPMSKKGQEKREQRRFQKRSDCQR